LEYQGRSAPRLQARKDAALKRDHSTQTFKEYDMNKLYGLIAGVTLAAVAPFALADADPLYLLPQVGGAEVTFNVQADRTGINSAPDTASFWYAGTSGVSSN
jgi:hypothetical protein